MNIILNASDALGDDSGEIMVEMRTLARSEIPAGASFPSDQQQAERYVALTVRDTGHGMDRETMSKIFDPFYSTKFVGRGLGLAAVHGIVRGHGAAIEVQSEVGVGTSFSVYMPASEKALDTVLDPETVDWSGEGTVLLVDDELSIIELATEILENANLRVVKADDGQKAIDIYRERYDEIDLVILDLTMPKLSGREVFDQLRAVREDVCIVLSSGYAEENATYNLDKRNLAGFVHKPYTPSDLLRVVRDSLS